MSHSHAHDHDDHRSRSMHRLGLTLVLVLLYMAAEVVGGILTGSLALLADAGHMLSDAASLGLAVFALWIARRPRSPAKTFGYQRAEILAALANGITLVVVAVYIVVEAWHRFREPREVDGQTMMWIAVGGLLINLTGMALLHRDRDDSLNVRGAWLHVLADTLGSVQAILAGLLIWAYDWNLADPIASVLIACLVVGSSWVLLRDSVNVLMEGTPRHIDTLEVERALREADGVQDIDHLHIWTITSGFEALSVHVRFRNRDRDELLAELRDLALERFGIEHSTVQLERASSVDEEEAETSDPTDESKG